MNNTLQNGFRILEFMADTGRKYSVKELSEEFKLPGSHVCRLLKTLTETGYIEQDKSRKYRVSVRILCLANACISRLALRNRARPYLYRLHQELGERVYLVVNHRGQSLIVDVVFTDYHDDELMMTIGRINVPNISASGKLCAAYAAGNDLHDLLEANPLERKTAGTIIDRKEFIEELRLVRERAYAVADGESNENVFAVAAPVFNCNGIMIGGVGAYSADPALSPEARRNMLDKVRNTAESVSFALGYLAENIETGGGDMHNP